ncbi:MAG: hypothetical protein ABIM02_06885 [candidate division WOR-3 bacterium]
MKWKRIVEDLLLFVFPFLLGRLRTIEEAKKLSVSEIEVPIPFR